MKTKHTPGPWSLGRFSSGQPCGCLIGPDGKKLQFDNCGMGRHVPSRYDGCAEEERVANAFVIAAAPEMLDALKVCVELLTKIPVQTLKEAGCDIRKLQKIHDAVAKAEGSSIFKS